MASYETLSQQKFKELLEIIYMKVQKAETLHLEKLIEEIKEQYLSMISK